jgi:hypothetical protein
MKGAWRLPCEGMVDDAGVAQVLGRCWRVEQVIGVVGRCWRVAQVLPWRRLERFLHILG